MNTIDGRPAAGEIVSVEGSPKARLEIVTYVDLGASNGILLPDPALKVVVDREGADFISIAVAYQYLWGSGQ